MKQINNYIQEKLKLNKSVINKNRCTLFPNSKNELVEMIQREIEQNGDKCSLNHIDVSQIIDMSYLFTREHDLGYGLFTFNGDISKWDVSNVEDMKSMFEYSDFNGDISKWDVSNVRDMCSMFFKSDFNGDISSWNVSNVENMSYMFQESKFNGDISSWNVSHVKNMAFMFNESEFNGDISKWDVSKVKNMTCMFSYSKFNGDISKWKINPECYLMRDIFYHCPIKNEHKPKYI